MKKPTATIAFQVLPDAPSQKQTIAIIDEVISLIKKSGVRYEVGPMETTMEGDLDTLFGILRKAQDICIKKGAAGVFSNVKILYSPKGVMSIEEKVTKHRS